MTSHVCLTVCYSTQGNRHGPLWISYQCEEICCSKETDSFPWVCPMAWLRSRDAYVTCTASIDQFILDPKSKQDKVKVTNLKNLPKLQIF